MPQPIVPGAEAAAQEYPPPGRGELHWPPQLTIVAAIALQLLLPSRLSISKETKWILPALEAIMLVALFVSSPQRLQAPHSVRRILALSTTALVSLANGISLVLLVHFLLHHNLSSNGFGHDLVVAGSEIWLTNVFTFSLWYWELDRGGPGRRAAGCDGSPDFLFPQMTETRLCGGWRPQFVDYLYVSLTNATAFSPTDTMPLSAQAKMIMGLQSLISLVTIGLVVARAVNIL
jgi:uncharacterized membrane protein